MVLHNLELKTLEPFKKTYFIIMSYVPYSHDNLKVLQSAQYTTINKRINPVAMLEVIDSRGHSTERLVNKLTNYSHQWRIYQQIKTISLPSV